MERKDLLGINGKIFIGQGQAIEKNAAQRRPHPRRRQSVQHELPHRHEQRAGRAARPLVCHDAPGRKPRQDRSSRKRPAWTSPPSRNLAIWGNHSATQYPDFYTRQNQRQARHRGHQGRGLAQGRIHHHRAAARRGHHQGARRVLSAASAANAVVDTVRSITTPTAGGRLAQRLPSAPTAATASRKASICSFPVRSNGKKWEIVQGLKIDEFSQARNRQDRRRVEGREGAGEGIDQRLAPLIEVKC